MKRLILISWTCIFIGCAMIILPFWGKASHLTVLVYSALGNLLLLAPYPIWILVSNRITAASLKISPSRIVAGLVAVCIVAFALTFGAVSLSGIMIDKPFAYHLNEAILGLCFLTGFASLIAASIIVSGQIVDAQEHPGVARGSRVFGLTICFFYVIIGMFFIASKLKEIEMNEGVQS